MIDFENEQQIPINQAPSHIPGQPNLSTVYRWLLRPVNPLESFIVGSRRFTTIESIRRFVARCTDPSAPVTHPTRQRQKEIAKAERTLAEAGIA